MHWWAFVTKLSRLLKPALTHGRPCLSSLRYNLPIVLSFLSKCPLDSMTWLNWVGYPLHEMAWCSIRNSSKIHQNCIWQTESALTSRIIKIYLQSPRYFHNRPEIAQGPAIGCQNNVSAPISRGMKCPIYSSEHMPYLRNEWRTRSSQRMLFVQVEDSWNHIHSIFQRHICRSTSTLTPRKRKELAQSRKKARSSEISMQCFVRRSMASILGKTSSNHATVRLNLKLVLGTVANVNIWSPFRIGARWIEKG
jgi:hypothetical protein